MESFIGTTEGSEANDIVVVMINASVDRITIPQMFGYMNTYLIAIWM
jgi:hypothetical protein